MPFAGAYGVVHLVIDRQTGKDYACKVLPKQRGKVSPEKLARKIRTEVELLSRVQVSSISLFSGVCCARVASVSVPCLWM